MTTFFLMLTLVCLAGWIVAEFKARKGIRLGLGLAVMVLLSLGMALDSFDQAAVRVETFMHSDDSLDRIVTLIDEGRGADIRPAVARHRADVGDSHISRAATLAQELHDIYWRHADEETGSR